MVSRRVKALISTLGPISGGVSNMTTFVVQTMQARGFEPVVAHYEPYSISPRLSVPAYLLLTRKPAVIQREFNGIAAYGIGSWLPEFEFTHYLATKHWRKLISEASVHLAISGNILAATPYLQTGTPYMAWVATDWEGDRNVRAREFPFIRRMVDRGIVAAVVRRLERILLKRGVVLALSRYTQTKLDERAGTQVVKSILPQPVDSGWFCPAPEKRRSGRIGFSGRLADPRKNVDLFLRAVAETRKQWPAVQGILIGASPDERVIDLVRSLGLEGHVEFTGFIDRQQLRDQLQSLDVFLVPSHQEGLCIAALEAMACGCPVVSTRCGGPEEFVLNDKSGTLVGFDPDEIARALTNIVSNDSLRERLASGARDIVVHNYSAARAEAIFWAALQSSFSNLASMAEGSVLSVG